MCFKEPSHLSDVGGLNLMEIEVKAELTEEGDNERVVFNGVKTDGGAKGGVHCTKVGGEHWVRKALVECSIRREGGTSGKRG